MLMACQCELDRAVLVDLKVADAVQESLSSECATLIFGPDITLAATEANDPAISMLHLLGGRMFSDPATLVRISTESYEYHLSGGFRDMRIHSCLENTISSWSPIRDHLCFVFMLPVSCPGPPDSAD